jgi:hypothetical protein
MSMGSCSILAGVALYFTYLNHGECGYIRSCIAQTLVALQIAIFVLSARHRLVGLLESTGAFTRLLSC